MIIEFEYADNGSPVLKRVREDTGEVSERSEPVTYHGIASLLVRGAHYIAVGGYYAGHAELTPGVVYLLIPQEKA